MKAPAAPPPETLESRQELTQQLANALGRQLGDLLLSLIGLVAEREPQLLRQVLSKAVDLQAIDEAEKRLHKHLREMQTQANVMASRCAALERRIADLETKGASNGIPRRSATDTAPAPRPAS